MDKSRCFSRLLDTVTVKDRKLFSQASSLSDKNVDKVFNSLRRLYQRVQELVEKGTKTVNIYIYYIYLHIYIIYIFTYIYIYIYIYICIHVGHAQTQAS